MLGPCTAVAVVHGVQWARGPVLRVNGDARCY